MNTIKKRGICFTLILLLICVCFPATAFAVSPGDTVSYSGSRPGDPGSAPFDGAAVLFTVNGGYVGTCIQSGVEYSSSGTATVGSASSDLKKAAYYFGVVQGYQDYLGIHPSTASNQEELNNIENAIRMEFVLQYLNGTLAWPSAITIAENLLAAHPGWSSVTVPDSFEVYTANPSNGSQSFLFWKYIPEGSLTIKKNTNIESNERFTFRIFIEGLNGTYSGVEFASGRATITLRGGQSKTIEGLPADASYTVNEINIPGGWTLASQKGDSGKIVAGEEKTATFTNKAPGKLKIKKGSANTAITGQ